MREMYATRTGRPMVPIEHVSALDFYGEGYEDSLARVPDIDAAKRLLEWTPLIGLEDALAIAIDTHIDAYAASIRCDVPFFAEASRAQGVA